MREGFSAGIWRAEMSIGHLSGEAQEAAAGESLGFGPGDRTELPWESLVTAERLVQGGARTELWPKTVRGQGRSPKGRPRESPPGRWQGRSRRGLRMEGDELGQGPVVRGHTETEAGVEAPTEHSGAAGRG